MQTLCISRFPLSPSRSEGSAAPAHRTTAAYCRKRAGVQCRRIKAKPRPGHVAVSIRQQHRAGGYAAINCACLPPSSSQLPALQLNLPSAAESCWHICHLCTNINGRTCNTWQKGEGAWAGIRYGYRLQHGRYRAGHGPCSHALQGSMQSTCQCARHSPRQHSVHGTRQAAKQTTRQSPWLRSREGGCRCANQ